MPPIRSTAELDFTPPAQAFPSPADWRDEFIYFLLVDRFDDDAVNATAYDPDQPAPARVNGEGGRFQGGNLRGIIRRLDYIKNLGCTGVWLSPVFKNRQETQDYHGYAVQDFLEVDPRFGTKQDLIDLVREAHARGLYVILDIIINHTGDNWAYPGDHSYFYWHDAPGPFPFGFWRERNPAPGFQEDDAVWPIELQNEDMYRRRGRITDWFNPEQALYGDFEGLKELDVTNRTAIRTLIDVYKYWLRLADVDGYRIDTVKHVEDSATSIFCNAVREYAERIGKHKFFIFGEIVADDEVLQRYIGRNSRIEGTDERFPSLDAALDFPLYFVLEEVIKGKWDPRLVRDRYDKFKTLYADHGEAGQYFVTFVDNHDQMVRPYRRFGHDAAPDQIVLAMAYLLSAQGVPCIYYGTEQAFDGAGPDDDFIREAMFGANWGAFGTSGVHFFDEEHPVYEAIARVAAVRKEQPAMRYGRQYFRDIAPAGQGFAFPTNGQATLAFSRILDTDEVLVALNLTDQPRNDAITLDRNINPPGGQVRNLLDPAAPPLPVEDDGGRSFVRVALPKHGLAILKRA